ncbi:helix-turn-helix domain-containing protein [Parapedobacter lycopersici]|uniref:helix-turn-helix domain-containing protein n=1 Tax=Parapedobacter lycopersici TaxID=1864939 RepID=UPI00214D1B66|nr:helix-turn-helix transcriptional regulator [Parapedobacter lycopersici]
MAIINRLDEVFEERKITNRVIANYVKKSEGTVSKWRNNRRQPTLGDLNKIAELLRVDIRELLYESNWSKSTMITYEQFKRNIKG